MGASSTLKYGISTLFILVSNGCAQLEQNPWKTSTSSTSGASTQSLNFVGGPVVVTRSFVAFRVSGLTRPNAILSSKVRVCSRILHLASAIDPMNSTNEFPDGSLSLTVKGGTGCSWPSPGSTSEVAAAIASSLSSSGTMTFSLSRMAWIFS